MHIRAGTWIDLSSDRARVTVSSSPSLKTLIRFAPLAWLSVTFYQFLKHVMCSLDEAPEDNEETVRLGVCRTDLGDQEESQQAAGAADSQQDQLTPAALAQVGREQVGE